MSMFDKDEKKHEIVIVRRGGGDHEEGHHGGVWKIAFADFMTAMMCFFLVMWLVNAANEETKAAVASYFNPMTLVDASSSNKGLDDPGENSQARDHSESDEQKSADEPINTWTQRSGPGQYGHSVDAAHEQLTSDQHLFSDPYAVLAEIAAQTATLQNVSSRGDGGAQTSGPASGAHGGESYRDPFAPDFWSQQVVGADDDELDVFREARPEPEPEPERPEPQAAPEADEIAVAAAPEEEEPLEEAATVSQAERLAGQIRDDIMEAFGRDSELNRTVTVTARAEGVLISVTDELNYGMFEVGSAVPQGELVLAMERIAATLGEHTGKVRISGHTDGRPFRSANYDNWRLSSARAHAAYYMLVRAGLDEARVREVAGHADRELKVADDPLADANRRIEIFLEADG